MELGNLLVGGCFPTRMQDRNTLHPRAGSLADGVREVQSANMPVVLVRDRGPAQYFHGRESVRSLFEQLRADAIQGRGGTTFLIQGAPGAGKTALLHQCAVEADEDGWQVAEIDLHALYAPTVMAQSMGEPYITREERVTAFDATVISRGITKETVGAATVPRVIKERAPDTGLLLVLDEVQTIRTLAGGPNESAATVTLNAIHNGKLGCHVILLAGGLGVSEKVFSALGISRFNSGCVVNLGRLSKVAEQAVIRDWLVKGGQAKGDVTPWVDTIADETQGWPQHIMCYAQPAAQIARHNNGEMTPTGLAYALAQGHEGKAEYYRARTHEVSEASCVALGNLLSSLPATDIELDEHTILETLKTGQTLEDAKTEFNTLLHKGVIAKTPNRKYAVSIPSMHDWLINEYGYDDRFDQP